MKYVARQSLLLKASAMMLMSRGLLARVRLRGYVKSFLRVQFFSQSLELGLFEELLPAPRDVGELAESLGATHLEALRTFLDLGVALGELRHSPAGYGLRSRTARALAMSDGGALRAGLLELTGYHTLAYEGLPEHLRTGLEENFLSDRGRLIARSSLIVEPAIATLVRQLVRNHGPIRILEIGCGSGAYLRHAAEANPKSTGVGLELDPDVAQAASEALHRWGVDTRFLVEHGDARNLPASVAGSFDLVTLFNNIYYFDEAERRALFRSLSARLRAGGRIAVVSMLRGSTPASLGLSLVLGMTRGCTPLPTEKELTSGLSGEGFTRVTRGRLLLGEPFVTVMAAR